MMGRILHVLTLVITYSCCGESQQPNNYIIGDLTRCQTESPDVLLWVHGRITAPEQRAVVRETMANSKLWPDNIKVMTIFLAGKPTEMEYKYQSLLQYEFEMYRDIVQTDFPEAYKTLDEKTITAINYISQYCRDLKMVIRMDDDVVFHPERLVEGLVAIVTNYSSGIESLPKATIACNVHHNITIRRKSKHPGEFYAADDSVLPDRKWYPPFCAGFFMIMSGDVPRLLQPFIATNPPFWVEDRYMGVLVEEAKVKLVDVYSLLDFGYHDFTVANMVSMDDGEIQAQHLPYNLKRYIWQIFNYLDSENKPRFTTIEGRKETIKPNRLFTQNHMSDHFQNFVHLEQQKRRKNLALRENINVVKWRMKWEKVKAYRQQNQLNRYPPSHNRPLRRKRFRIYQI